MDFASTFMSSFLVGLSGAIMPGSLLIVNVNETSRRGVAGGVLCVTGHAVLELIVVVGFVFGLGDVLSRKHVAGAIGLAGSATLLWMAWGIIRDAWRGGTLLRADEASLDARRGAGGWGRFGPVVAGSLATISNAYWTLWWATVGAAYVALALRGGPASVGAFYLGHIGSDFSWYLLVSLAVVAGRQFISDRLYRGLLLACGLFLLALAGYFLWTGVAMVVG
ncbi:MAG: LysE family transporter [Bacillota bacterium]